MATINETLLRLFNQGEKLNEKQVADFERYLLEQYRLSYREIDAQIVAMFRKFGDSVNYAEMARYNRLENLKKAIQAHIRELEKISRNGIERTIKSQYSQSYYYTGYATERAMQITAGFGALSVDAIQANVLNQFDLIGWPERVKDSDRRLYRRIFQNHITQGLIQGKGYSAMTNGIKQEVGKSYSETKRIIRTETHRVQNGGRVAALEKVDKAAETVGVKVVRIWNATLDSRTRPKKKAAQTTAVWTDNARMLTVSLKQFLKACLWMGLGLRESPGMTFIAGAVS